MKVSYTVGRTLNMGNYESARFEIGVERTCKPEDLEDTFEKCKLFVDEKMKNEQDDWDYIRKSG